MVEFSGSPYDTFLYRVLFIHPFATCCPLPVILCTFARVKLHPMTPDLTAALRVATDAAQQAGQLQLSHLGKLTQVRSKSNFSDLVTEVDGACEALIRRVLLGVYPQHRFLGEEEGEQGAPSHEAASQWRWVVDPLDGTVNYAHGFPVFCVSIALERITTRSASQSDAETVLGVVYDPTRRELFTALRGQGAYLNDQPLGVSGTPTLQTPALVSTGFAYNVQQDPRNLGHLQKLLALGVPVRRPGSAALDLCYTACGRLDAYWELGLKRWDVAAGALMVQEAGGQVTDAAGQPDPYAEMIVASNGLLHPELLAVLAAPTP